MTVSSPPDGRPVYRLLTGKDDRAFCDRVSEALAQGWVLYGSPAMAYDSAEGCTKVAQAVIWKDAVAVFAR
ncbi:hypothetical protein GCM10011371_32220 [Novosphingobium marinum]|uniref:DUF1737 domain-containing protein n=1 Tax=Novosphingobium marinum TaxID=1514948 RepID=A0A7Z0BW32_9SPHN|nr:DUF1737 domain-containing protein [Novosphingobium marinum]NYH96918.1 hypothetical protein [Novosphingobium marinum]GGC42372.1 hypothetical protein GCM10011371_32220 [Novosphingobium marinum]